MNDGTTSHRMALALIAVLAAPFCMAEPGNTGTDVDCGAQLAEARQSGAKMVMTHLSDCNGEAETLKARLAACQSPIRPHPAPAAPAELHEAIRHLYETWDGQPISADAFDPLAALAEMETFTRPTEASLSNGAEKPGNETETDLTASRQQITDLNAQLARCETDHDEEPAPPLLTHQQLQDMTRALLRPEDCDQVEVAVSAGGKVSVSGVAATKSSLSAMRERFTPVGEVLARTEFAVALQPGGRCNIDLGGGWSVMPNPNGKVVRVKYRNGIEGIREGLPTLDECKDLEFYVEKHPDLSPYFLSGETPMVWCRRDDRVGICKRSFGTWSFLSNPGNRYTGFLVIRARTSN